MTCSEPGLIQGSEVPHCSSLPDTPYCPVCFELIIEPVVYPCAHEVCKACFEQCVATGNLHCPVCRHRISSWARRSKRNGCVVDEGRRKKIAQGLEEALGSMDAASYPSPMMPVDPVRVLCSPGQLEQEYKTEMRKVKEEEEEQIQKDKEQAERLQKEEDTVMMAKWQQMKEDESLALKLSQEGEHLSESPCSQAPSSGPKRHVLTPKSFLTQPAQKRPVQDKAGSRASKKPSATTPQSQRRKSETASGVQRRSEGYSGVQKARSPDTTVHIGVLFNQEWERLNDSDYCLALKVRENLRSEERAERRGPCGNIGGLQGKKSSPAPTILKFFAKEQA